MADSEKKIKANAAKARDSAADKSASLAGATHEAPAPGTSKKKGKLLPKNKTPRPSTAEESPAEGRSPSVEASLAGARIARPSWIG